MKKQIKSVTAMSGLIAIVTVCSSLLLSADAHATPLTYGDEIVRALRWPANSTLNVYIQQDPANKGRDQMAKEGVERWKTPMAARGITINVSIGNPPAGTQNEVVYQWKPENFTFANLPALELGTHDGMGVAGYSRTRLLIGKAFLHQGLAADTDAEKLYIRNVAEHEMVHVLGFADDEDGEVMNHAQPNTARNLNRQDTRELNTLYGTGNAGGNNRPMGMGFKSGGSAEQGFFDYHFVFDPGNDVADPFDSEHISLINLGIHPSFVTGIDLPPGWIGLIADATPSPSDPFFDDYMEDGTGDPPPWDPTNPFSFIAFRTSRDEATADGLSLGDDPALSLEHFELDFRVYTKPHAVNGTIPLWAGDELQFVEGPVLAPEPSSLILLAAGLAAFFKRKTR